MSSSSSRQSSVASHQSRVVSRQSVVTLTMAAVAIVGLALPSGQQSGGVFTADQAAAGRAAYQANCASCHMPDLAGRNEAPPLAGGTFLNAWRTRTTRDLVDYMQATMPPNA